MQELPSYDEIYQSVVDFVNNVKPSIIYTHKTIEGYWKTRCKWDSCEEYYVDGKEFSNFESKNCLSFKDDTIDINFHTAGSGNYEQDIQRKYDFIFSVCSFLKNKTFVWHKIISHYSKRRHDNHTHYSTTYYVTFEFESTDRLELQVTGTEYGLLYEGDQGILTFQGTIYLGFDRK